METPHRLNSRKLLKATVGLAAVSYLGTTSCDGRLSSGNLVAPPYATGGAETTGGKESSGGADTSGGETTSETGSGGYNYYSGNLVAPYYPDPCQEPGFAGGSGGGEGGVGGDTASEDPCPIIR